MKDFGEECHARQEKDVVSWARSSAACGYVLTWHSKQGRVGYLEPSDSLMEEQEWLQKRSMLVGSSWKQPG